MFPLQPHYHTPFHLEECQGNNAFDYEERCQFHPSPYLHVASLIHTDNLERDLKSGREICFEINENHQIKSFAGLKNFLHLEKPNQQNIYIFDNHNHAFYFWHYELFRQTIAPNCTLIHIDQHKDSRIPTHFLPPEKSHNLNTIFEYTNQTLNVGNFIPPAVKSGLLTQVINIDSSTSVESFFEQYPEYQTPTKKHNLVLDLDLDFFAPELDYINNEKKLTLIKKILPQASLITIATSPFFIDQNLAINWCKKIIQ